MRFPVSHCLGVPLMAVKRVIKGVHVVPMGMATASLIEGDDGLTLIDAGFPGKEALLDRLTASPLKNKLPERQSQE